MDFNRRSGLLLARVVLPLLQGDLIESERVSCVEVLSAIWEAGFGKQYFHIQDMEMASWSCQGCRLRGSEVGLTELPVFYREDCWEPRADSTDSTSSCSGRLRGSQGIDRIRSQLEQRTEIRRKGLYHLPPLQLCCALKLSVLFHSWFKTAVFLLFLNKAFAFARSCF